MKKVLGLMVMLLLILTTSISYGEYRKSIDNLNKMSVMSGFQIFVNSYPVGNSLTLNVDGSDSIETIKQKIEDKSGIPPDQQLLYYKGKKLEDSFLLEDYNIISEDTIFLIILAD